MERRTVIPKRGEFAWLSASPSAFAHAMPIFAAAGYRLIENAAPKRLDLVIVDLRDRPIASKAAVDLAAEARRTSPDCGIVYVGAESFSDTDRAHLRRSGEFVLADDDLHPVIGACRNRLRIRNIAEETGERLKSIAASTRLCEFPPIETCSSAPRILIAGAPGGPAAAAFHSAEAIASSVSAVFTAGQAMQALETEDFDCAVFLPRTENDPLVALSRSMRRHRKYQDLPVIVVAPAELRRRKLSAASAADYFTPELCVDLPGRVLTLVRRARLMAAMRKFLGACVGDGVRDRASGVFTPQFFAAHAERIFARAEQTKRPASLVGLRLAPPSVEIEGAASVRTLRDAARLIGKVTRAEDCVARISSDTFAVLMSATAVEDALGAARRIEGVIANTMFRTRGERRLFAVAAATVAVEYDSNGHLEETLATVLSQLKAASPRTAER